MTWLWDFIRELWRDHKATPMPVERYHDDSWAGLEGY